MSGGQVTEIVFAGSMVIGFPIWDILTMGELRRNSTHATRMRLYRLILLVEWGAVAVVWALERVVRGGGGLFLHLERNPLPKLAHGGALNQGLVAGVGAGLLIGLTAPVLLSRFSPALAEKTQAALKPIMFLLPRGREERFAFFLVALTAGFCEEVLYRGFLLHVLSLDTGISGPVAVGLAAVAFGAAHAYQGWLGAVLTCAAGFGFLAVYCITGSLLPGILIHALIDIRPLFLLRAGTAFQRVLPMSLRADDPLPAAAPQSELRVCLIGTGLIGASLGLALRSLRPGMHCRIVGWDANPAEIVKALEIGAIDEALASRDAVFADQNAADIYVLATPVLPILDWMRHLAPVIPPQALVTDVGSTKREIVQLARGLYNGPGQPTLLPSHPMAGKEAGGAALAEATLFRGAAWLFTPVAADEPEIMRRWRSWIAAIGAHTMDLDAEEHDRLCAWVSHLPQMLSTALSAVLEETFADDPQGRAVMQAIGGRALRETTRLGSSPYSMWRDIALTNTPPIAATLFALEQKLTYLRENLRTPGLRDEFALANRLRLNPRATSQAGDTDGSARDQSQRTDEM